MNSLAIFLLGWMIGLMFGYIIGCAVTLSGEE